MSTRRRLRAVTHRKFRFNKAMNDRGKALLDLAYELWQKADGLDTAVRDEIAEGVARVVRAGYDCLASNIPYHTTDEWMAYIDHATQEWFRERGFAEWFCIAASRGFSSSRPRDLAERIVRVRVRKPARRTRRAISKEAA
jgi:hypothetical protein